MFQSEFAAFQQLMGDLCEAYNRPLKDDLVRVFWDALKEFPLQQMKARVKIHIATAKKFPTPADLKPAPEQAAKPIGPSAVETLNDYLRDLDLTVAQYRGLVYVGTKAGQVTGVQIPTADGTGTFRVMLADIAGRVA